MFDLLRLTYRRRVVALLFLVLALDFADRTLLGALGPTLKQHFSLSNTEFGLLAATFVIASAAGVVPAGVLADRVKRTLLLAGGLILWTCGSILTGAAMTVFMLFGGRALTGAISAVAGPTIPSMIGDLMAGRARGRALGVVDSGQLIGTGAGFLLAAVVAAFLSFRWGFWLLALAGVALIVASWRLREPERSKNAGAAAEGPGQDGRRQQLAEQIRAQHVTASRAALLHRDPQQVSLWGAAKYTLRVRTELVILLARAAGDYFFAGVSAFVIVFATQWYRIGQSVADLGMLVLGIGALAGILTFGWASDRFFRSGRLNGRIWLGVAGYGLGPGALLPALFTRTLWIALPFLALGAFLIGGASPPLDAARVDVLVPGLRGRTEAVRQLLRTAAEGAAPAVFGVLSDHVFGGGTSGLRLTYLVTLPALLLSGLLLLVALRTYKPDIAAALASAGAGRSSTAGHAG